MQLPPVSYPVSRGSAEVDSCLARAGLNLDLTSSWMSFLPSELLYGAALGNLTPSKLLVPFLGGPLSVSSDLDLFSESLGLPDGGS